MQRFTRMAAIRTFIIAFLLSLAETAFSGGPDRPLAVLDLRNEPAAVATTLAFVSDGTIAISRYPGPGGRLTGTLLTAEFRDGKFGLQRRKMVDLDRPAMAGGLYAAAHGRILSKLTVPPQLLSGELREVSIIQINQIKVVIPPEHQANFVGEFEGFNSWKLHRLVPTLSLVRAGSGEVLSVTDEFIAVRGDQDVRIETIDGVLKGSFQVPSRSTCYGKVNILGQNRLLMTGCQKDSVVDFRGRELSRLPPREGWGFRFGQSLDGTRILFDNYTRRISFEQKVSEFLTDLITFGMGVPVESKGETIRVVDTRTAGICFELESPDHLFGRSGEYHADISPSGDYLALVTTEALSVYRIPSSCTAR
jgi:hypothetical protein